MFYTENILIMYHSVSSLDLPGVAGSKPINLEKFKSHIKILRKAGYELTSIRDLGFINSTKKRAFITSDDGTVDWGLNVLPWCEKHGIPTHTSVLSGVERATPKYPKVHLVQEILGSKSKAILDKLRQQVEPHLSEADKKFINKVYKYEQDNSIRVIKGALNFILPDQSVSEIIKSVLSSKDFDNLKGRFLNIDDYRNFSFATIGNHTESHRLFDGSVLSYYYNEILPCGEYLKDHPNFVSGVFTLPSKPKLGANKNKLYSYLKAVGFRHCLTSFAGYWDGQSFEIPRIDAKDLEVTLEFYQNG